MFLFKRPPKTESPEFQERQLTEGTIYYASGTFLPTHRICRHYLTCRQTQPGSHVLRSGLFSRAIAAKLLEAEKRSDEYKHLRTLLAMDESVIPSHHIQLKLVFNRDRSEKELFTGSLNFRINGYSTQHVAVECCRFIAFLAAEQEAYIDESGNLRPPPLLTQSKVWVREFWATAIYRRYRQFALYHE